ncbi:ferredoxin-1, chloroplastic [Tanacetum coccineum]|uniref:Ferredoxin-1, chloroplastic n=1 Tax=Tanacetum coccineum TaxID=301880 RepID=A0ABQ5GFZ8_9ASTR
MRRKSPSLLALVQDLIHQQLIGPVSVPNPLHPQHTFCTNKDQDVWLLPDQLLLWGHNNVLPWIRDPLRLAPGPPPPVVFSSTIINTPFLHRQQPCMTIHSRHSLSNQTTSLFGLNSHSCRNGATMMASHKVTLITPDGTKEFECPDDVYIIDQASDPLGLELSYSWKSGACSSCARKVKSGSVN